MQHGEIQIAERLTLHGLVLAVLQATTGEAEGTVAVLMRVRIAHAAANTNHRMIQKRA